MPLQKKVDGRGRPWGRKGPGRYMFALQSGFGEDKGCRLFLFGKILTLYCCRYYEDVENTQLELEKADKAFEVSLNDSPPFSAAWDPHFV